MGTWGHGIFEDDVALDVRDEYFRLLAEDELTATASMLPGGPGDVDEAPVFWLSLAATQVELGRLDPIVKEEALRVITDGAHLALPWKGDPRRRRELEKLRKKLVGPQRAPRLPPRPRTVVLRAGDVFRFEIAEGRFCFGRILIPEDWFMAFYRWESQARDVPLAEVVTHPLAFVVSCNDAAFRGRRWRVIGNLPLEAELTRPRFFFHQSVGSPRCVVYDIWPPGTERVVDARDCTDAERWGAFGEVHVLQRLGAVLAGEPDPWPLHDGPTT